LLYFESKALRPELRGFTPGARYRWQWFDPRSGEWSQALALVADASGAFRAPAFVNGGDQAEEDLAAKVVIAP
jgi:hypothetical protein